MTDQLNIGVRFMLYANLMLLFGLPLFGLYAFKGAERLHDAVPPFRALVFWLSASGIFLSLLSIVAMTASMAGVSLFDVDRASVSMMIFETPMGNAWVVRMLALLSTFATGLFRGRSGTLKWLALVTIGSTVALASIAWTGHGAAGEGVAGTAQLIADVTHLLCAGAWLGALAALSAMLFRCSPGSTNGQLKLTHRSIDRFSNAGSIIVLLIIGSGLYNGLVLVGPQYILSLPATLYGQVLIAKLILFGAMLALAAINRWRLAPALGDALRNDGSIGVIAKLRTSMAFELGFALIILGLVAWLGTLEPPMSK
jgi:copper resistance protein D